MHPFGEVPPRIGPQSPDHHDDHDADVISWSAAGIGMLAHKWSNRSRSCQCASWQIIQTNIEETQTLDFCILTDGEMC